MAWLAWALLGCVLGLLFKMFVRTPGPGAWFVAICVGVAGGVVGGWIASIVWGEGVLDVRTGNLIGTVIGAIILLVIYWYRVQHRRPGTQYINPNAM